MGRGGKGGGFRALLVSGDFHLFCAVDLYWFIKMRVKGSDGGFSRATRMGTMYERELLH